MGAPVRLRSTVTRTSGVAASLGLARTPGLPCGSPWACDARCVRPTSASQHIHYEHPRLARSRCRRAARRIRRFTTPLSLRRALDLRTRGVLFPVTGLSTAPLMLLSRPSFARRLLLSESRPSSRRQDRFGHKPRERNVAPTTRSTFGRWVASSSRCPSYRFRPSGAELVFRRSRDFAITIRLSAFLRPHLLAAGGLSTTTRFAHAR
jgi:hypothetical protein